MLPSSGPPNGTSKIQVVDGGGQFNEPELQKFVADSKLAESKTDYQIVAIMGPQSSGKSTLMNHVVRSCAYRFSKCQLCCGPPPHAMLDAPNSFALQFGTSFVMMDAMTGRAQTTKVCRGRR